MKTKSIIFSTIMMLSIVATSFATSPEEAGMAVLTPRGSKIVKVVYKAPTANRVTLNLYNSSSKLIFTETFASIDGFIRPLNFSGLEYGEYTIELIDTKGKKVEKITYEPIVSTKFVHINKLKDHDGKFLIAVVSENDTEEKVNVKIYNQDHLIFDEEKSVSGGYAEIYNLKSAKGPLTFQITDYTGTTTTVSF